MQLIDTYTSSFIKRNPRITDIGCGPGQFANFLSDHMTTDYLGLDFSGEAITMAQNIEDLFSGQSICRFKQLDLTAISKFTGQLDADIFTSLETLEHIEADTKIIEAIPEGKLVIISVPTFNDEGHVRFFSSESEVSRRYGPLIGTPIEPAIIERIRSWFIIYGIRNSFTQISVSL